MVFDRFIITIIMAEPFIKNELNILLALLHAINLVVSDRRYYPPLQIKTVINDLLYV